MRKSDALGRSIVRVTADVPKGAGSAFPAPTSISAEPSISQYQPSGNIVLATHQAEKETVQEGMENLKKKGKALVILSLKTRKITADYL